MSARRRAERASNGALLRLLALGHAGVAATVYGEELRAIGREGVVGAVPYRGAKATAFWFLAPAPVLWIVGDLLSRAERAGDQRALRRTSLLGLACALLAGVCVPVSGFWMWAAISLRGLRDARRMRA